MNQTSAIDLVTRHHRLPGCLQTPEHPVIPVRPGVGSYEQLQQEVHSALRAQHPEWILPNGDCPICESYESRLAELLRLTVNTARG
jgi:hypothetical protein